MTIECLIDRTTKDVWCDETQTLTRFVYAVGAKQWVSYLVMPVKGMFTAQSKWARIPKPLWRKFPFTDTNIAQNDAYKHFADALMKEIPAAKYWLQKLNAINANNYVYIARLAQFKDIPETESLIMSSLIGGHNRCALILLEDCSWKRLKSYERKIVINAAREGLAHWCSIKNIVHPKTLSENALLHIGWGNTAITQKDISFLESHPIEGMNTEQAVREFHDYLSEQETLVPDICDPYWRYRKNWRKIHQKTQKAIARHRRMNGLRIFLGLPEKTYSAVNVKAFKQMYKPLTSMELHEGELHAYFSDNIHVWERHAVALRQCLMSCKYYQKTYCRILFFTRNGIPEASAEITKGNRVGQFMGDERSQVTIQPKDDVRKLLDKFLATYKVM